MGGKFLLRALPVPQPHILWTVSGRDHAINETFGLAMSEETYAETYQGFFEHFQPITIVDDGNPQRLFNFWPITNFSGNMPKTPQIAGFKRIRTYSDTTFPPNPVYHDICFSGNSPKTPQIAGFCKQQ